MKRLLFILLLLPVFANGQIITTIAGNGTDGYSGDNGPATAAEISSSGIAVDGSGNVFIADQGNNRIRKVDPSGIITTIAGNGTAGNTGNGGPATDAEIWYPNVVTIDKYGNVFIADGNVVCKVDPAGIITIIAGNGMTGYSGDGGAATNATFRGIGGVAIDTSGDLYISDGTTNVVRKVDNSGIITTIAGNGIAGLSGDGGAATAAELNGPGSVAVDDSSNIYVAEGGNNRIRKINFNGIINTIAGQDTSGYNGDNRPATTAELNGPSGVKVDNQGNVYFVDAFNDRIRRVNTLGIITTIAGTGIGGYSGDGGNPTLAELEIPSDVALDPNGNIYISDADNYRIRLINYGLTMVNNVNNNSLQTNVYPNPTTTSLTITSPENITNITITNLIGQAVYMHEHNSPQVNIDVADLPAGVYFVKVNDGSTRLSMTKKFVKE